MPLNLFRFQGIRWPGTCLFGLDKAQGGLTVYQVVFGMWMIDKSDANSDPQHFAQDPT